MLEEVVAAKEDCSFGQGEAQGGAVDGTRGVTVNVASVVSLEAFVG